MPIDPDQDKLIGNQVRVLREQFPDLNARFRSNSETVMIVYFEKSELIDIFFGKSTLQAVATAYNRRNKSFFSSTCYIYYRHDIGVKPLAKSCSDFVPLLEFAERIKELEAALIELNARLEIAEQDFDDLDRVIRGQVNDFERALVTTLDVSVLNNSEIVDLRTGLEKILALAEQLGAKIANLEKEQKDSSEKITKTINDLIRRIDAALPNYL